MTGPVLFLTVTLILRNASAVDETGGSLLLVSLTGFEELEGIARIAVFDSAEHWPEGIEFAVRRVSAPVTGDTVIIAVRNLEPGDYSFAAFHDRDSDSVFDRGLFGIPSEIYGFSNGARGSTGPPDYSDAVFSMSQDTLTMEVRLE
ncbi:MAG: hypothetical protein AVO35_05485 [Candidatus Aegiribacteria sp. MLS_C]|nr:MAG: hypothetical protein AVO35_05485 [Candidatus Aegiribacteria sp. MLS_C]